jgi:hypothetical protein
MSYAAVARSATASCIGIARDIIKSNRLFDPPDLDGGRMPRVSKWER